MKSISTIKVFLRRPFIRNVAVLASGTAASQAISMAFSPLVTRLYGPEVYGIQGVFMTVAGLLTIPAALTYPVAIVLPESDADALGLAHLSIFIGMVVSILTLLTLYLFGDPILSLLNAQKIVHFIYLIPVVMFITVLGDVTSQWLIRKKAFSLTARVKVLTTFLASSTKAGLGFVVPRASVLIALYTASGLVQVVLMWLGWRRTSATGQFEKSKTEAKHSKWFLARQHIDFAIYRTPQNLINGISASMPVILLASYFGPASVGYYSIASAVLVMPAALIGNSVMQVFYPRISEAVRRGEDVRGLIVQTTKVMALAGAFPFAAVIVAGPALFSFVFGQEWRTAGVYGQWLSIWLFFQYINKPAVAAIPALHLQKELLIYELFSTGTKFIALYIGFALYESDVVAIALFSVFGVIAYVLLVLRVIFHAGRQAVT